MKKVVDFLKSTAGMVLIVTLLAGCVVHLVTGNFWTAYNISTLTRSAAFVIIVSFGQTLVLLTGGIDLSVAAVGSVASMVAAKMMVEQGISPAISILASCLVGLLLGLINGLFIAYLKLTPFIVTLATAEIYKGIVYIGYSDRRYPGERSVPGQRRAGRLPADYCDHYGSDLCDPGADAQVHQVWTSCVCAGW